MSVKRHILVVGATNAIIVAVSLLASLPASAATHACGSGCIAVFSRELGTYAQPNFVEDILGGKAQVGQPVGLKRVSGWDPSEDIMPLGGLVSDFHAAGMVSADIDNHYGNLRAVQQEYAPLGARSGLCVGLASVAYQGEGLTLQPCSVAATTVWIVDPALSATSHGYFPIINGSTTDFRHPFAMDLPQDELRTAQQTLQMQTRHLQFLHSDPTLPDRQLWGALFGPFD